MTKKWVLNASPIIVLAKINHAWLFHQLANEVRLPQAVAEEIMAGASHDPARLLVEKGTFSIVDNINLPPELIAWDLGKGETSVLAYAYAHTGWTAILDDGLARKCAKSFLLPVKGTLGVILLAKKHGIIDSASDLLRDLKQIGFRINDHVIRKSLWETVGERWLP